ncbi:MAG: Asp-tRNA(Asn)/Glu-tRNA(Gln) amidotransferase subunit GatC [Anaerolineae bacterium]|nr:Asp-tRNA(Asn)/Glu-tRNA(Gln) amidotransferase subunit GatC [Anaerolineae bacterium]
MKLSHEEVRHIAELAKLGINDEEVEQFSEQLSAILEYAEVINRLDTDAIPPTAQVIELRNVMRDDEPRPSSPVEEILANAPRRGDDRFQVQAILE